MGIFTSPDPVETAPSQRRAQGEWTPPIWKCSQCDQTLPRRAPLPGECPQCHARREYFTLAERE